MILLSACKNPSRSSAVLSCCSPDRPTNNKEMWEEQQKRSLELLNECDIKIIFY